MRLRSASASSLPGLVVRPVMTGVAVCFVMTGRRPGHPRASARAIASKDVDARDKRGHDEQDGLRLPSGPKVRSLLLRHLPVLVVRPVMTGVAVCFVMTGPCPGHPRAS